MTMRQHLAWLERATLALLLAVHIAVYFPLARIAGDCPTIAEFLYNAIIFAQAALLAIVLVLGLRAGAMLAMAPLAGFAAFWLLWIVIYEPNGKLIAWMIVLDAGGVSAACFAARRYGVSLGKVGSIRPLTLRVRYSLRGLMIFVWVFAYFIGPLGRYHAAIAADRLSTDSAAFATGLPAAATAIGMLWTVMAEGPMLVRGAIAVVVAIFCGSAGLLLCGREADWWGMALWLAPQAVIIAASLAVLRACGYRLVRLQPTSVPFRSLAVRWNTARHSQVVLANRFVERLR